MNRKATFLTLALLLVGTAAPAAERCFQDDVGDVLVFKKHKTPKPGDCQPLHGYQHGRSCGLHGTACGTTDGVWVRYNFTYVCGKRTGPYGFIVRRADGVAAGESCDANLDGNPWGCSSFGVYPVACPTPRSIP